MSAALPTLRSFEVTATLERPAECDPPPAAYPLLDVMAVHTAVLSEWRLPVRAASAAMALTVAEALLPEACGATWTVAPAVSR
jgi:hypothetical protein